MPNGSKKNNGPAVWVGGQRRKITRKPNSSNNVPRSSTMPAISPDSAAASLVSSVSGLGAGYSSERLAEQDQQRTPQESQQEDYFSPPSVPPIQFAPPSSPFSSKPVIVSPRPSTAGATMTGDGHNSKTHKYGGASFDEYQNAPTSGPLPPLTPSKAAQFLGISPERRGTGSPGTGWSYDDGLVDDPVVRKGLRAQKSMPLLTKLKQKTDKSKFKENISENESPKPKKDASGGSHKAKRMFDFLPSKFGGSKRASSQDVAESSRTMGEEDDTADDDYSGDYEYHAGYRPLPEVPQAAQPAPSRRRRKKDPKVLERMSPITETSFDDLRALRDGDEHDTELEVISEYEDNLSPAKPASQPLSATKTFSKNQVAFELDAADLSPTTEYVEDVATETNPYAMHPGTQVDPRKLQSHKTVAPAKSPLQTMESRMLDVCQEELAKLDKIEAERKESDEKVAKMKREHEQFKTDFNTYLKQIDGNHNEGGCKCDKNETMPLSQAKRAEREAAKQAAADQSSDESDDGLIPLRKSIDLDEEPTVHTARAVKITKVTPGMLKVIDIPARKNPNGSFRVVQNKDGPPVTVIRDKNGKLVTVKDKPVPVVNKGKAPSVGVGIGKATPVSVGKSKVTPAIIEKSKATPVIVEKNKVPPSKVKNRNRASAVHAKNKARLSVSVGGKTSSNRVNRNKVTPPAAVEDNQLPPTMTAGQFMRSRMAQADLERINAEEAAKGEREENVSPNVSHRYSEMLSPAKPKKNKLPRDESRLMVQDWISNSDRTTQRPVSERIDADVLADREIPPAPFPKTDESVPFTPPKHSNKHQCVLNGHAFKHVNLRKTPDETGFNNLQVRSYLQTATGTKQQVDVPVMCDRCGINVKDDVWVCEISICQMAVCRDCANIIEKEWRTRAVAEWKHTPRKKI